MVRVLVIGGTGFIGPFVVRELHRLGHHVTVLSRGQSEADLPPSVGRITGNRHHLTGLRDQFRSLSPDVVIDDPVPLTEDSPLRANPQPYPVELRRKWQQSFPWLDDEYDKIAVERAILSDPGLPGIVLRLPMVYGPGDRSHRLFPILKRVDGGRPVILLEETLAQWRAPRGYAANVAAAVALAAVSERAAGRIYNVAEPKAFSELEWTDKVARAAGFRGEILVIPPARAPAQLQPRGNHAQHWVYDTTHLRTELGYQEPVSLEIALRETIAWERAHPPGEIDLSQFNYAAEDAALAAFRL